MLMCFLKVCPYIKPVGKHCVVEKKPDQCCPTIKCPQGKSFRRFIFTACKTTLSIYIDVCIIVVGYVIYYCLSDVNFYF